MFKLLRYFSLASAAVIVVVIALLMVFFHHLSVEDLVRVGERQNEILARSIGNHVWDRYAPHLRSLRNADRELVTDQGISADMPKDLSHQTAGLPVVKVNILNARGIILFSTEPEDVGNDKTGDPDFREAQAGRVTSKVRDSISNTELTDEQKSTKVLSTYLPYFDDTNEVVAVFEIHSDITSLFEDIDKHVLFVFFALLTALCLLYLVLYQIVRRADRTIKRQHEELMASEEELRRSETRHRQFAGDVAHELRMPLSVLQLQLDAFDDSDKLSDVRRDVTALSHLVEQLLALARLDNLAIDMNNRTDLRDVCANVAARLAPYAIKMKRSVEVQSTDKPVYLAGNADALEQAIYNLVDNAIKYSPEGGSVTVEIDSGSCIKVIDRGPGVPEQKREMIFERFMRADESSAGAGLGLSIVKRILEMHNATIDVGDTPGGGATFTIRFASTAP